MPPTRKLYKGRIPFLSSSPGTALYSLKQSLLERKLTRSYTTTFVKLPYHRTTPTMSKGKKKAKRKMICQNIGIAVPEKLKANASIDKRLSTSTGQNSQKEKRTTPLSTADNTKKRGNYSTANQNSNKGKPIPSLRSSAINETKRIGTAPSSHKSIGMVEKQVERKLCSGSRKASSQVSGRKIKKTSNVDENSKKDMAKGACCSSAKVFSEEKKTKSPYLSQAVQCSNGAEKILSSTSRRSQDIEETKFISHSERSQKSFKSARQDKHSQADIMKENPASKVVCDSKRTAKGHGSSSTAILPEKENSERKAHNHISPVHMNGEELSKRLSREDLTKALAKRSQQATDSDYFSANSKGIFPSASKLTSTGLNSRKDRTRGIGAKSEGTVGIRKSQRSAIFIPQQTQTRRSGHKNARPGHRRSGGLENEHISELCDRLGRIDKSTKVTELSYHRHKVDVAEASKPGAAVHCGSYRKKSSTGGDITVHNTNVYGNATFQFNL